MSSFYGVDRNRRQHKRRNHQGARPRQPMQPWQGMEQLESRVLLSATLSGNAFELYEVYDVAPNGTIEVAPVLEQALSRVGGAGEGQAQSILEKLLIGLRGQDLRNNGATTDEVQVAGHNSGGSDPQNFFPETGNEFHYAWYDQIPETPGVIDVYYDFRNHGVYSNLITDAQKLVAEAGLQLWSDATGGAIQFHHSSAEPKSKMINIGVGDMAAFGYGSAVGGTLAVGGGVYNPDDGYSITSGIVWLDMAETWDLNIGNGNLGGTFDFFTVVAHEVGHSLGIGHMDDLIGRDLMDGFYTGELTGLSANDLEHVQHLYGSAPSIPTAGITVTPTSGLTTSEWGSTASFNVVLDAAPTSNVTISISSSNTSEGTVNKSSLTFTSLNWNVAQSVTVTGVDDLVADGPINYSIITGAAVSSDAAYSGLSASDVSVTNLDDDVAGITVTPTSGLQTTEAGGTASFNVVLTSRPTSNVTISIASSDTTEGTVNKSSLTFTASNWNVAQTVTVTGVDDADDDGNVAYSIVTGAAVSSDANYSGLNAANVSVTNLDDDEAPAPVAPAGVIVSSTSLQTTEDGGTASFTVVLASQPTSNVIINLYSTNTAEGTVSTGTLTFTPDNWNVAQTVTVTGVDDADRDGDVSYSIVLEPVVSADLAYAGLDPADISVTNKDNEKGGLKLGQKKNGRG